MNFLIISFLSIIRVSYHCTINSVVPETIPLCLKDVYEAIKIPIEYLITPWHSCLILHYYVLYLIFKS